MSVDFEHNAPYFPEQALKRLDDQKGELAFLSKRFERGRSEEVGKVRTERSGLRRELKAENATLRAERKGDMAVVRADSIRRRLIFVGRTAGRDPGHPVRVLQIKRVDASLNVRPRRSAPYR